MSGEVFGSTVGAKPEEAGNVHWPAGKGWLDIEEVWELGGARAGRDARTPCD